MHRFQAVLFDLDGTLLDSAPGIFDAFGFTLAQFGVSAEREQLRRFLGPPLRDSFAQLLPEEQVERAIAIYRERYAQRSGPLTAVYPGVPELLAALRAAGCTVCLATSKVRFAALRLLREKGLASYFDFVGGSSEDASLDTKTAVMRYVLAQPCLRGKSAVMVGDRDNDMQGAADCGLPAAGVLYGYGSRAELAPYGPLTLTPSVQALQDWLLAPDAACIKSEKEEAV